MKLLIKIDGEPVAKGRARTLKSGRSYTPKKTHDHEQRVIIEARNEMVRTRQKLSYEPIIMIVSAYFEPASRWPQWKKEMALDDKLGHIYKPDIDNIIKLCKDALNNIVYKDDSQVVNVIGVKGFDKNPHTVITVIEAPDLIPCSVKNKKEAEKYADNSR